MVALLLVVGDAAAGNAELIGELMLVVAGGLAQGGQAGPNACPSRACLVMSRLVTASGAGSCFRAYSDRAHGISIGRAEAEQRVGLSPLSCGAVADGSTSTNLNVEVSDCSSWLRSEYLYR